MAIPISYYIKLFVVSSAVHGQPLFALQSSSYLSNMKNPIHYFLTCCATCNTYICVIGMKNSRIVKLIYIYIYM